MLTKKPWTGEPRGIHGLSKVSLYLLQSEYPTQGGNDSILSAINAPFDSGTMQTLDFN